MVYVRFSQSIMNVLSPFFPHPYPSFQTNRPTPSSTSWFSVPSQCRWLSSWLARQPRQSMDFLRLFQTSCRSSNTLLKPVVRKLNGFSCFGMAISPQPLCWSLPFLSRKAKRRPIKQEAEAGSAALKLLPQNAGPNTRSSLSFRKSDSWRMVC